MFQPLDNTTSFRNEKPVTRVFNAGGEKKSLQLPENEYKAAFPKNWKAKGQLWNSHY